MKPVKIVMLSLTHGHTRKYFHTRRDSPKLNLHWHRKTIEAMNACYDSIARGQPVAF